MSRKTNRIRRSQFEGLRLLFPAWLTLAAAHTANGSTISVTPAAALEGGFGLQIFLAAPDPTPAWIAVGPEKGLQSETAIEARFLIDPSHVNMEKLRERRFPSRPRLCFLSLAQELNSTGARLTLCLEKGGSGAWVAGAQLWDDTTQAYVQTRSIRLTESAGGGRGEVVVESLPVLVEIEWGAASQAGARDGYFRLSRIIDGQKHILLEREHMDNGTQSINYLQVGVVSQVAEGVSGELYLDAIEISRAPAAPN